MRALGRVAVTSAVVALASLATFVSASAATKYVADSTWG
jgi:hypothetical protein